MRFKKALRVEVYVYSDEELSVESLGIDIPFDVDGETETISVYSVELISDSREGWNVCILHSGGSSFYVKSSRIKMMDVIEEHGELWAI